MIFLFSEHPANSLKVFKFSTPEILGPDILNKIFDVNIQVFEMESSYFYVEEKEQIQMHYALDANWIWSEKIEEQIDIQYYNLLHEDMMASINGQ